VNLKFKTTEASGGHATLQNPAAPLGLHNGQCTYEVTGIPAGTPVHEVMRLFNDTTIMPLSCHSIPFSECGTGRIYWQPPHLRGGDA